MSEVEEAKKFIVENGAGSFVPDQAHYNFDRSNEKIAVLELASIAPVTRACRPFFDPARGISILEGFQNGNLIEHIRVLENEDPQSPYPYQLYDGFHRLYLSRAVGFSSIPAEIFPRSDWSPK